MFSFFYFKESTKTSFSIQNRYFKGIASGFEILSIWIEGSKQFKDTDEQSLFDDVGKLVEFIDKFLTNFFDKFFDKFFDQYFGEFFDEIF